MRQSVFACLTCNPPPADTSEPYDGAGVCYACSVQCHGEHTLVEIFHKRDFTCDCGTTRLPATSPCALRLNPATNTKGGVHSEEPSAENEYNQNFRNRFCACACDYDPFQQKGTMFQCLGLGTHKTGGCGEDWYHPGCLVGLGPNWFEDPALNPVKSETKVADGASNPLPTISEDAENGTVPTKEIQPGEEAVADDEDEMPAPPGFPAEEDFEGFICYKCVDAFPWIKRYAGAPGFLPPVFTKSTDNPTPQPVPALVLPADDATSKKRKADDDEDDDMASQTSKRPRSEAGGPGAPSPPLETLPPTTTTTCKLPTLPPAPSGQFSLFFTDSFRSTLCRCPSCFPLLQPHPQLLDEEENYEPPVSEDGSAAGGGSTVGSGGSLLERGESALRNVDRVRAIEGVMAYNHLKDKLKPFFQQFAESGQAISAEDIKAYFAKLRGDEEAIREAGEAPRGEAGAGGRGEQEGY